MDTADEITPEEAAKLTGYSTGHIRWLIRNKKICARRIGERVYLIDRLSVLAYAARMRTLGSQKHAPQ